MLQQYVSAPIFVVSVEVPVFPVFLDKGEAPEKSSSKLKALHGGITCTFFSFSS